MKINYSWPKNWHWLALLLVYFALQVPALAKSKISVIAFAPTSQTVGNTITIIGSDLNGVTVTFSGGRVGVVTSVTNGSTVLTVIVPDSCQSGPMVITRGTDTPVTTSSITILNVATTCAPSNGNGCSAVSIRRVNITGSLDQTSTCQGSASGSYVAFPVSTNTTASLTAGTTFTLNATLATGTGNVAAFIDWNRNGTFESNEYYSLGSGVAAGSTASLAITVPSTAAGLIAGLTTMRIRAASTAIGSGNSCTAYTTGETQDFYITLAPSQSAPAITSFSPSSASIGSTVTVTGNVLQNGTFSINGVTIPAVINGAGNSAVLTIPSGVTSGRISIVTPGGNTLSSGSLFMIGANDILMGTTSNTVSTCSSNFYSPGYPGSTPAVISNSNVLISPATAGNQVRLAFSSFSTEARFDILTIYNGADATAPVLGTYSGTVSVGTITASNATGQLYMTFVSDNGGTGTGWVATVGCIPTTGPLVTTFAPQTGAVGSSVTITGLNLQGTGATTVSIGSTPATVTATSPTSLTFTVGAGSTTGPITVTNSLGTYTTAGSPSYFLVTPSGTPTITSITPTSGLAGDSVVIIGTNLIGALGNSIRFTTGGGGGGGFGATVRSNNGIRAVVIVPTNAITGVLTVTINNNTSGTTPSFTVLGTPTFSAFQNNGGGFPSNITSTQVGASIRILGSNLAPGGVPATITFSGGVTAVATGGGTQLTVTVPVGAITGPVTITTTAGTIQTASLTILEGPVITSFTPTASSVGGTVTIAGSGLTGSTFFFTNSTGGITSALPSSVNAAGSSATVVVPLDAITGTVQVSTTNGTSTSTATLTINNFTFAPASGSVGSTLTINYTGIAFTGNPTVTVNGVNAVVTNTQRVGGTNYIITATVGVGTTSGLVVVSNNGNVTTSATSFTVTVAGSAPTITSVNPNTGGAGTAVRINGTNFIAGSTFVYFSGASGQVGAANIQVVSGIGITCDVPSGAVTGFITVTTGNGSANSPSQFTVTAATPTISALSPNSGSAGNTITIVGANFTASSTVSFGGVPASSVVYLGTTVLQAIVPTGTAIGLVNVTVSNGTLTSSPSAFTVSAPPLTLSPTVGARGSSIIITGSNFAGATVNFGTVPGVITFNSGFDLQVTVPNSLPDGDVAVLVNTTSGSSSAGTFTVLPLPTITSFTPLSNSVNTVITVSGTNLNGVYDATINGVSVPYIEVDAFTGQITVPVGTTSGFIQLFTQGGTATSANRFTVITGTPSITSFSPSTIASGSTVTISGFFLNEVSQVYFNGTPASNLNLISGNTITVTAPNIASSGYIVVVSALGNDTASLPYTLAGTQFCDANNPSVPVVGRGVLIPSATRQTVSLATGNRYLFKFFGEVGKAYSFSTCRSGNGISNNDSYLRIFQGSGIVPLILNDDNGTSCGNNAGGASNFLSSLDFIPTTSDTFTLLYTKYVCSPIEYDQLLDYSVRTTTAPAIYTFTPTTASIGNDVTIFGAGFVAGSVLTVNGTPVTYTTITPYTNGNFATRTDFTKITFTIPSGVTSGVVSINGATGTATTTDILSIVPIGAPTIASFSPFSGTTGTQVTITGANFTGATVRFSGVGGNAPIISQNATTLIVTVPANSVQGPITVTNASGSTSTSNSFLITAPVPTVSTFTPASADRGATVVINGTGFTGVTGVTFGGVVATYTFLNDTTISAIVPSTATAGQVSVTTAGGTGNSVNAFIVNLPVPTIVTFSPTSGLVGTTVDIIGTNLSGATVYFGAIQATTISNNTNTSVSAVVPAGAATGYIQVYNSFNNVGTSPIRFTILVPPNIFSVSGTQPANYGGTLVITGTDLANSTVSVGGISYTVTANTNISITVTVPNNAVNGTLQVTNSNGTAIYGSTILINTLSPVITSTSPQSAYFGSTIVLRGRNLRTATTYTFGGTTLAIPAGGIANDTVLTLQFNNRFTAYPNSILPIVVTTGQGPANSQDITYGTANPSRFCGTAFNDGGIIRPSTTEQTVIGELGAGAAWKFYASRDSVYNFNTLGNTQTRVNGRLSPDTYLSIFRISNTTTTPDANNDDYSGANTLSNLDFTPTISDTFYVTITQYPTTGGNALCNPLLQATQLAFSKRLNSTAPYISSFTVTNAGGGTIVTNGVVGNTVQITGVNLPTTAQNFTLNGVAMPVAAAPGGFRAPSATVQYVTIPVGATSGFIVVTSAAGTGQSQDQLIINSTTSPTITNFTPTSASVGSRITITGTNLTGCTFEINGAVQTATGVTATTATITINSGAGTGGPITATNATGEVFITSSSIVITQPAPTLTSFSPLSGLPGSTVTISGTGLLNPNGVTLNGIACTVVSSTASQIVVTIPTNATSGVFTVNQGSIGTASSVSNFTVVQGAVITSFTPTSGAVGDTITITGSNLTASAVRFNGALASVTVNTSTTIKAIVPVSASTGTITATTTVNTATSAGTFTVTTPLPLVFGVPSGIPATVCAGAAATVSISVTGTAGISNVYTVVGSNSSGSFASPTSLGSISSNATGIITIPVTIPSTGNGSGYRYRVVASSPASTSADNGSNVSVSPIPATPTISAGGATTFCSGGSVTLTASAGPSYLWSNGSTSSSITVTTGGSYTVKVANAAGCISSSSAATVVTISTPPTTPTISASGSTTVCEGNSVVISGPIGASGYVWSNGATTQSISVTTTGSYTLNTISAGGCTSALSNTVAVTVNPVPTTPTISASGATTFCSGGSVTLTASAGTSYIWSNGATTSSISVNASGTFTVQVTNASGCTSAVSASTVVTVSAAPATPTISASGSTTICDGGSVTLNGPTSPGTYFWSNGATTQNITVNTAGTYSLVTILGGTCTSRVSNDIVVTVNPVPSTPTVTPSGTTTFCTGGSVILAASATGATSYLWSTGATTQNISVSNGGSYTVQAISSLGCTSSASVAVPVTVNTLPSTPSISASGSTSFCIGNSVTLNGPAGASSYIWSNGATTQNITVSTANTYSLVVTNSNGCTSAVSNSIAVTVNPLPATPTIAAGGATTFCTGGSVTLTASAGTSYLWSTGATTASISVNNSGNYTVQVINGSGCTSAVSAATAVTVNTLPALPTISTSGATTFCSGGSVTLSASAGSAYIWSNGATTQSISANASGSFTVKVINASGCTSATSAATTVTVNSLPTTPTITASGATTFCDGGSVTLTATSATAYIWSNGATTRTVTASASGSFSVQLINASGCTSAASAATVVTVSPLPTATTVSASGPVTFCIGGSVDLSAPSAAGYIWSNGATTQTITATTNGTFSYRLISAAGCTSASSTATTVSVVSSPATPSITASGATTICSGSSVGLTASAGSSYLWSNGATTQSISAATAGSYTVQVRNASGCISAASSAIAVTVNPVPSTPSVSASGATTFCSNDSIYLTATGGTRYLWNTGDTTATIKVKSSGTFTVQANTASGCLSASSAPITTTVNTAPAKPVISASGPIAFCAGGSVTLTAPASDSYLWSTTETTQSITVSTNADVTVTVGSANGCNSKVSDVIRVRSIDNTTVPIAITTRGASTTVCEGSGVWVYGPAGLPAYTWSTGESSDSIFVRTASTVRLSIGDGSCNTSVSNDITVSLTPRPTAPLLTVTGSTTICAGESVVINAPATADAYIWSNGSNGSSLTATTSGTYFLRNVSAAGGCISDTSNKVVITVLPVTATPSIVLSGASSFCEGDSVVLTAPLADAYLWSNNATTQSIVVKNTGNFSVQVGNTNTCFSDTSAVVSITVNPVPSVPTITASGSTTICEGNTVTLSAPDAASYLWSNGATTATLTVSSTETLTVQVTNTSNCQSVVSAPVVVTVNPTPALPVINSNGSDIFCEGNSVVLTAPVSASYLWSTGETTQDITVSATGNYTVRTTNASGCNSAVSAPEVIVVNPVPTTPVVTLTGTTTFCEGGSAILTAPTADAYLWSDGSTTQSVTATATSTYSVQTITTAGCTSASSTPVAITVNTVPNAPVILASGSTTFCAGGNVQLSAAVIADSYLWSNGATTASITVSTTDTLTLQAISANGCASEASLPVIVTVNPVPATPVVTASGATTFCEGGSVTLTAPLAEGYVWSNGATTQSIDVNTSSDLSVVLTTAAGCTSTASSVVSVVVNATPAMPVVSVTGATTFCAGSSTLLSAPLSAGYLWNSGETTQTITATASGSYAVKVISASACTSMISDAIAITVTPASTTPVITATGSTSLCGSNTVTLNAPVIAGASYIWSNGANTSSTTTNVAGDYTVQIVEAGACTSAVSNTISVIVNPAANTPTVIASGPTTFCNGGSVTLTASAAAAYLWSDGSTTQSISATSSGSYTVQGINAEGCTSVSSLATVVSVTNSLTTPTVSISGATTFCTGGSVILTSSSATRNVWSNGATTRSITVTADGVYSVQVTSATGCTSSASTPVAVTVNTAPSAPVINASGSTTLCDGGSVTLSVIGTGNYVWSDGTTGNSVTALASASYTVREISAAGCTSANSAPTVVTVNPITAQPVISLSGSATFCTGGSVTLSAPLSNSYLWSTGETTQSISVSTSEVVTVQTTDAGSCQSIASSPIAVVVNTGLAQQVVTPSGITSFCEGGSVVLSAIAADHYLWSTGDTTQTITVSTSGSYSVSSATNTGCSSTVSAPIVVTAYTATPLPVVSTSNGTTEFCDGGSVTLSAQSGFRYLWSTGDTTQSIVASAAGNYTVTLLNNGGCSSATSAPVAITVSPVPTTPTITASNVTNTICNGSTITLTATAAAHYLWSTGDTTQSITVRFGRSYTVTLINAAGCSSVVSDPLRVTVVPIPTATTISRISNDTLVAAISTPAPASYQWYYNGSPLTGATSSTLRIIGVGTYYVTTISANGCASLESNTIVIDNVATKLPADLGKVYPNPFAGVFNLELNNLAEETVVLHITDVAGREVMTQEVSLQNGATKVEIAASALPNGMYNLLIDTSRGRLQSKLIKQ